MAGQSNKFSEASVSGGFNLQGNQFNGNVKIGGSYRDDTEDLKCLRLLKTVNPEDERRRILTVKDQLVTASYSWILEDKDFQSWRDEDTNHLLWIKGGPGKGKTMMMAGLVDVLSESRNSEGAVAISYFFCQNSESELRKVTSIVKGLIYMLAFRERSLVHHLKETYEAGGEEVFTGPRALSTLWGVLEVMLRDTHDARVYLLVDGLDECDNTDVDEFLYLLSRRKSATLNSIKPGKIKWLVTSRPLPRIEHIIGPDQDRCRISLEIEAQRISQGVETFINEKVKELNKLWSAETTENVRSYLQKNAEGTFLWVALVCQRLRKFPPWEVKDELTKLTSLQRGLDSFYERMMQAVRDEIPAYADLCMKILRTTTLAYRPLRLQELGTVVALPDELQSDDSPNFDALRDLIERCGSFILVHEDAIYFVHQSAKDYLSGESSYTNFPLDRIQEHTSIAEKCLDTLNSCLKDHQFPDPTSLNKQELGEDELQLLSKIAYTCSYWIHHAFESVAPTSFKDYIPNQERICDLLEFHLIAWVHALGSLKEVTSCVGMIKAFLDIQGFERTNVFHMMQETYRFLRQSRHTIEESPNEAYTSALLFLPQSSWIRKNYQNRIPKWIKLTARLNYTWDACLETLLGHSTAIQALTFSSDGSLLASKSNGCTRLWETETGKCRGMMRYDRCPYTHEFLAFSPDDRVLIAESGNGLEILDIATGSHQHLPVQTYPWIRFNSQILASFSFANGCLDLWNMFTGEVWAVFEPRGEYITNWAFSNDDKRIAVVDEGNIEIWDLETLKLVATFREHCNSIKSIQFSPDSCLVLSVCSKSIWIWPQATAKPGKKLESHLDEVGSAKFSPDGSLVLSVHKSGAIMILWETSTGNKLHVITPELGITMDEAMISPDSKILVAPNNRGTAIWDTTTGKEIATLEVCEPPPDRPYFTKCSKEGNMVAQVQDTELRIWEVATGDLLDVFGGHLDEISAIEFSPAGGLVASASERGAVQLWTLKNTTSSQPTSEDELEPREGFTISSDGTLAAFVSFSEGIHLLNPESGFSRILLRPGEYDLGLGVHEHELVISPDKNLLACRMIDEVWVRDTKTGSLRYTYLGKEWLIRRVSFSLDGSLLKIEDDHSIRLVENHSGAFEDVLEPPRAESTQSQLSPDGRFIVKQERSLRAACLWEREGESDQRTFRFELGGAGGVATFSPDSKFIAFVSSENLISVWEVETGACHDVSSNLICSTGVGSFSQDNRSFAYIRSQGLSRLRANYGPTKVGLFAEALAPDALGLLKLGLGISRAQPFVFPDPVKLVTFSPDARMVAAVSGSAIVLWKTPSGPLAEKLEYEQKRASAITFLPDRNILIAGYEDGTIGFWDTNNYALLHTRRTKDRPPRFSLDSKRKFLWTGNRGFFFDECLQPDKKPAISLEGSWVLFKGERVFRLPRDFMPFQGWAASDKCLVMGHRPNGLTIVRFDI